MRRRVAARRDAGAAAACGRGARALAPPDGARRVADRVGLRADQWQFGYQSAGHAPEDWLNPDFKDLVPGIAEAGHSGVIFVPVQFLADHLEILYDIDVAGREEAEEVGLSFHRIPMPNTSPTFIDALRQVVDREVATAAPPA